MWVCNISGGPAVSLYEQDINRVQYTLKDKNYSKESIDSALHYSNLFFKYSQTNDAKDWEVLRTYTSALGSWRINRNLIVEENGSCIINQDEG